jgi:hypothetical protein
MATAVAVAMRQAEALERIKGATATLQRRYALGAVELEPQARDRELSRALLMEAVAGLLEELVQVTDAPPAATEAPATAGVALEAISTAGGGAPRSKGSKR